MLADRLCEGFFFFFSCCCQIREAEWSNNAELSQVRDRPTFSKNTCAQRDSSELPTNPPKPQSPCIVAAGFVFGKALIRGGGGGSSLSDVT